jgi:hypothetical protein
LPALPSASPLQKNQNQSIFLTLPILPPATLLKSSGKTFAMAYTYPLEQ